MSVFGLGMVVWFFYKCVSQNFEGECECLGVVFPGEYVTSLCPLLHTHTHTRTHVHMHTHTLTHAGCDALMPGPLVFIVTLFGVFEGFLFSLFTCIMFCTQIYAIYTDETVSVPSGRCLLDAQSLSPY